MVIVPPEIERAIALCKLEPHPETTLYPALSKLGEQHETGAAAAMDSIPNEFELSGKLREPSVGAIESIASFRREIDLKILGIKEAIGGYVVRHISQTVPSAETAVSDWFEAEERLSLLETRRSNASAYLSTIEECLGNPGFCKAHPHQLPGLRYQELWLKEQLRQLQIQREAAEQDKENAVEAATSAIELHGNNVGQLEAALRQLQAEIRYVSFTIRKDI